MGRRPSSQAGSDFDSCGNRHAFQCQGSAPNAVDGCAESESHLDDFGFCLAVRITRLYLVLDAFLAARPIHSKIGIAVQCGIAVEGYDHPGAVVAKLARAGRIGNHQAGFSLTAWAYLQHNSRTIQSDSDS